MGLWNAADDLGKEVRAKQKANDEAEKLAEQAKQKAVEDQQRHEEDKKQGMI
jgi:hypothetical protein